MSAKHEEVQFWRQYLIKTRGADLSRTRLRSYFEPMLLGLNSVRIADVGSGAISMIGHTWPNKDVEVRAMDLLAEEYSTLVRNLGLHPQIPVEYQDMTHIDYPDEHFDIVHCSNALDHCSDPHKALQELVRICKVHGCVYLRHFEDEGAKRRHTNMHCWNIKRVADGDCLFWTQSASDNFLLSSVDVCFHTELMVDIVPSDILGWEAGGTPPPAMLVSVLCK